MKKIVSNRSIKTKQRVKVYYCQSGKYTFRFHGIQVVITATLTLSFRQP